MIRGNYEIDDVAGDAKLSASLCPSLKHLFLVKPAAFFIDYNIPDKDVKFQIMNTVRVLDRPVHLRYTHWKGENQTALDGTLMVGPANKLSASCGLDSGSLKVKYCHSIDCLTSVEPGYDFSSHAWDFTVSRKVFGTQVVSASYQSSTKVLGLSWKSQNAWNGSFQTLQVITATMNLAEPYNIRFQFS